MKGKLIKKLSHNQELLEYWLYCEKLKYNLSPMAKSGVGHGLGKLSLKNCQAIELGYDLDELAEKEYPLTGDVGIDARNHLRKEGFQKALGILGDKKFSENDIKLAINLAWDDDNLTTLDIIQELQQTEWEVEIEEFTYIDGKNDAIDFKLDANGCLILKRK